MNRKILKIHISKEPISERKKENLIQKFRNKNKCSKEDAEFFIFSCKISNSTYNIDKSNINILMKNGDVIDITSASDQFNSESLNKTVNKYFLCYTNE